jgi:hypothetical protein
MDRQNDDETFVAHDWLTEVFEPAVRAVPRDLRPKLEPAQLYHERLAHRWFLSEAQKRDVPMREAVKSYTKDILPTRPDEESVLGVSAADLREDADPLPVLPD